MNTEEQLEILARAWESGYMAGFLDELLDRTPTAANPFGNPHRDET
jgi:hypothetical protein